MATEDSSPLGPEDLEWLSTGQLLALYRLILAELRRRGAVRSGNAPTGDYAELLVKVATGGELAPASQKSWDVETPEGEKLQVKARVVTDPRVPGERQLSPFASWDFDAGVIVLFDDTFRVWKAAKLSAAQIKASGRFLEQRNHWRVMATDSLLEAGEDWTEKLRRAADS